MKKKDSQPEIEPDNNGITRVSAAKILNQKLQTDSTTHDPEATKTEEELYNKIIGTEKKDKIQNRRQNCQRFHGRGLSCL